MEIGVLNALRNGGKCFEQVRQFGVRVCQMVSWDTAQATEAVAETVVMATRLVGAESALARASSAHRV